MPTILGNKIWTYFLEDASLTINESDGVVAISIQNISSVKGFVRGNAVVAGLDSVDIDVRENNSVTISSTNGKPIKQLVIDASDVGCTLLLVANS